MSTTAVTPFKDIFANRAPVIGMIHLQPLPGTHAYGGDFQRIVDTAIREAAVYKEAGIDGLMIENMHDTPYLNREVGHEISTTMAVIGYIIKNAFKLPCGIQILAGANTAAIAAARSAGLDFVRAEGFVFGHVADEGLMNADAGELLRFRKMIDAQEIPIWTDIRKKHSSHAITADIDLVEAGRAAAFCRSDGLIVTGMHTGVAPDLEQLTALRAAVDLPVILGSGITVDNVADFLPHCEAMIIGSHFKKEGKWQNEVDFGRVAQFMAKVHASA